MKLIPDGSVDMILCDLPYGTTACKWDTIIPFEPLWEQYNRVIKKNGAVVLFGSEPFSSVLRMSNIKNYKYDWIWKKSRKTGHLNAKKRPMLNSENISAFYKKQPTYNPQGVVECDIIKKNTKGRKSANVFGDTLKDSHHQELTNYPARIIEFNNEHNVGSHPTQKPVALFEYLIKTYTNEGETVLDNCAGSFTTAIAALNTNRKYICMEKEQEYFEIGEKRIKDWHNKQAQTLFGQTG